MTGGFASNSIARRPTGKKEREGGVLNPSSFLPLSFFSAVRRGLGPSPRVRICALDAPSKVSSLVVPRRRGRKRYRPGSAIASRWHSSRSLWPPTGCLGPRHPLPAGSPCVPLRSERCLVLSSARVSIHGESFVLVGNIFTRSPFAD